MHSIPIKVSEIQRDWNEYENIISSGLENGGRFKAYKYTVSVIFLTYTNSSIYFIPKECKNSGLSSKYNLITGIFGWWGFPWGPIQSIQSFMNNSKGGKDVTMEIAKALGLKTSGQVARQKFIEKQKSNKNGPNK